MRVNATTNTGMHIHVAAVGFPDGTVLSGGETRVTLVLTSEDGNYEGHLELSPEGANILGEELRKAAESATTEEG